jgi:hypothetical protein
LYGPEPEQILHHFGGLHEEGFSGGESSQWRPGLKLIRLAPSTCRISAQSLLFSVARDAKPALPRITAMAERSKYQQKIIKNYYENIDTIQLQRLGEQVTEIYLAEGKARAKRWKEIAKLLEKMKVPQTRIDNIVKQDNPALLAKLLEELLAKAK